MPWTTMLPYAAGMQALDPRVNVDIIRIAQRPLIESLAHIKQSDTMIPNFIIHKSHKYFRLWTDLEHISFS
jgi:hypothetical protein